SITYLIDRPTAEMDDGILRVRQREEYDRSLIPDDPRVKIPEALAGYLIIEPKNGNKHIALEVEGSDRKKFWTISPSEKGDELQIGQYFLNEAGETEKDKTVISFKEDNAIDLNVPLTLKHSLSLLAGVRGFQDTQNPVGIESSGFKGFSSRKFRTTTFKHSLIHAIPPNTFGKYRIMIWVRTEEDDPEKRRYYHHEYNLVFFPDGKIIQKTIKVQNQINKLIHRFKIEDENKQYELVPEYSKQDKAYRFFTDGGGKRAPGMKLKWGKRKSFKEVEENFLDKKKVDDDDLVIALEPGIGGNREVFFSIERLWEGEDWV
ncbi:MAG: hypothetical protein AAFN93_20305, partial [Bacteroidota bacterium]